MGDGSFTKISTVVAWSDNSSVGNDSYKCNVLYSKNSKLILDGKFEGIPENLIINVISWVALLILFTFLRKRAWDYGRIALVQKHEQKWTQVFYGEGSSLARQSSEEGGTGSMDSVEVALHQDKGLFSWVKAMILIKDDQILKKNGPDAIQYLSFQRHIIFYLVIVCACSLLIILPVNCNGNLVDDRNSFGRTTLSNVDPESKALWIHVILSFLFVPLGIIIMKHFSVNLKLEDEASIVSRTLMITRIPTKCCDKSMLLLHFQEAYPDCVVQEVQLAYDVKHLIYLDKERETAMFAKMYCESLLRESGESPRLRPYPCGRICVCSQCKEVDAFDYYNEKVQNLTTEVDRTRAISLGKPLGIAFVTFLNESMAESVYKDHQKKCKCSINPHSSTLSQQLKSYKWGINFSPPPEDIFWENLAVGPVYWWIKAVCIYLGLFLLFFLFTTPTIILNYLDFANQVMSKKIKEIVRKTPILSEFLSTLVLLIISVLLPVIVRFSVHHLSHWTRSTRNHSIMVTTFLFLLFMVVILPLLQLTSVRAFMEWIFQKGGSYRWKCIFLSGNGAFFVNYIITASFIGTVLELIRFSELFMYVICVCHSRSKAEQAGLRNAVLWEFEFGVQYAWFLLIFSVVIIYSLVCPLIAPFGLLYMCMKHYIDRHNIFFVYGPSKINRSIHATAINFVMISLILMQTCLFFFLFLRNGWTKMSLVSCGFCFVTVMVFVAQISFHWFQLLSPIAYKKLHRKLSTHKMEFQEEVPSTTDEKPYMPVVLKRPSSKTDLFIANPQERSYGTNEDSITTTPDDDEYPVLGDGVSHKKLYQRF